MRKTQTDYSKLLLDPRWQKKRLEILNRDEFACRACGNDESTLHVHHCYYSKGKRPWDYADSSLVTLCVVCHEEESNALQEKITLCNVLSICGFLSSDFNALAVGVYSGFTEGHLPRHIPEVAASIIGETIRIPELYDKMAQNYFSHIKGYSDKTKEGAK
jgi:hypothetical protein